MDRGIDAERSVLDGDVLGGGNRISGTVDIRA